MGRIFRDIDGSVRIRQGVNGFTACLMKRTAPGSLYAAATQYVKRDPKKCLCRTRMWKNGRFLYRTAEDHGQQGFSQMGQDTAFMADGIMQTDDKNETCCVF